MTVLVLVLRHSVENCSVYKWASSLTDNRASFGGRNSVWESWATLEQGGTPERDEAVVRPMNFSRFSLASYDSLIKLGKNKLSDRELFCSSFLELWNFHVKPESKNKLKFKVMRLLLLYQWKQWMAELPSQTLFGLVTDSPKGRRQRNLFTEFDGQCFSIWPNMNATFSSTVFARFFM